MKVRFGPVFGPQEAWTETETGLHIFKYPQRLDRTDRDRFSAVLGGLTWLQDRLQTGLDQSLFPTYMKKVQNILYIPYYSIWGVNKAGGEGIEVLVRP